jgi:hypothetical protein
MVNRKLDIHCLFKLILLLFRVNSIVLHFYYSTYRLYEMFCSMYIMFNFVFREEEILNR